MLLASSADEMERWVGAIRQGISEALGMSSPSGRESRETPRWLVEVRSASGNDACADCSAASPSWASINLGVLICMQCAAVHRKLGTHVSKVRSLELDTKEWSPPLTALLSALGNEPLNATWHHALTRPPLQANESREEFIRSKYVHRLHAPPPSHPKSAASELHAAVAADLPLEAARCLIRGASLLAAAPTEACGGWREDVAARHGGRGRTALHVAAAEGSSRVLELLLQNGAAVDAEDDEGYTALRLAVSGDHELCVQQLLQRSANISRADHSGCTPLQCAQNLGLDALLALMVSHKLAEDEKLLARDFSGENSPRRAIQ